MTGHNNSFSLSEEWVRRTGEAIAARNGVILKDCISRAEAGEALTFTADTPQTIARAADTITTTLMSAADLCARKHPWPVNPRANRQDIERKDAEEREQCVRTAARVALTGALVAYQRKHKKVIQQASVSSPTSTNVSSAGAEAAPIDVDSTDAEALESHAAVLRRSCQDTLLKGLLFAFEAFVSMHAMNRDHYPPRTGNKTAGTVGWDTLVLLHFVHHIPQIARDASGAVIDEATGELVRSWRKLLVALQAVDANEAAEHSRRRGALSLVNGLLIIMFQRYNTHQCTVFLSAVEHAESVAQRLGDSSKSILQPSQHMVSEVVTYHYYKGRMHLYERRYAEAHAALQEAYHLLPPPNKEGTTAPTGAAAAGALAQQHNKQRVRFFLMVAGLLSGRRTPQPILDADPIVADLFAPLVSAVEAGNPVALSAALEVHGAVWRRRGVYLLLQQQAKLLCYLMLIARTHAAIGAMPGKDNSRITLANMIAAYQACVADAAGQAEHVQSAATMEVDDSGEESRKTKRHGKEGSKKRPRELEAVAEVVAEAETVAMDDDRMALWVVKLIAKGYLRGYLSHEHKTLVLSKKDPFPLLTQAPAPTA